MAWNNYNNNRPNYGYSNSRYSGGYARNGQYGNNSGYNNNRGGDQFKKSGASYTEIRKGKFQGAIAINAWRKTKYGILTLSAFPISDVVHTSKSGNDFMSYIAEVTNKALGTSTKYTCLLNLKNRKLVIKELGMVVSPNGSGRTSSGKSVTGYFGKSTR